LDIHLTEVRSRGRDTAPCGEHQGEGEPDDKEEEGTILHVQKIGFILILIIGFCCACLS
jgi:hypothetical protein